MVREDMSAVLLTVTVALGTAAPEESITTPVIFPVTAICAYTRPGKRIRSTNKIKVRLFIAPPNEMIELEKQLWARDAGRDELPSQNAPKSDHERPEKADAGYIAYDMQHVKSRFQI
jgi:hypothetical protein